MIINLKISSNYFTTNQFFCKQLTDSLEKFEQKFDIIKLTQFRNSWKTKSLQDFLFFIISYQSHSHLVAEF